MELCLALKKFISACLAAITSNFVGIGVLTRERTLGSAIAQHIVRKWIKAGLELFVIYLEVSHTQTLVEYWA